MNKINIPNSLRKYIRREKAKIRRTITDPQEQAGLILKLRERVIKQPDPKK